MTIDKPEVLAPNAPVTLHGRDVFNRPLTPARTTAEGLETTTAPATYNQGRWETTTTGGMVVAPYKPWAKMENVMSTPAYQAPDGKTYAKLLGLAAFPRNATVKVTNTRLRGEGAADHTVQIQKLSNAGAGAVEVPALQGDLMEVEVSYPAVPGKSQAASVKYTYTVPMASKGALREAKYRTNTGIAYLPVVPREREAAE
jgi:hypothetical protein